MIVDNPVCADARVEVGWNFQYWNGLASFRGNVFIVGPAFIDAFGEENEYGPKHELFAVWPQRH